MQGARTWSSDVLFWQPVHQASWGWELLGERSTTHHPDFDFAAVPSLCGWGLFPTSAIMTGLASAAVFWIQRRKRKGTSRRKSWSGARLVMVRW